MKKSIDKIFHSPLGRRLFLAILLFSSLITLVITSYQIYFDYRHELSDIETQFERIRSSNLQSIIQSVWVVDDVQVQKQLQGLTHLPNVEYALIKADGEEKWSFGESKINNEIAARFPLVYHHRGKELVIGALEIKGSLDGVYMRLIKRLFVILASNAMKTALVAVFVLFLFYILLGKHILALSEFASHFGKEDDLPGFRLDRDTETQRQPDELDQLVSSINQMVDTLHHRESDLRIMATSVEQSPVSIILTDAKGNIQYVNPQFTEISGYTLEEIVGKNPSITSSGNTSRHVYKELWKTIKAGDTWTGEFQNRSKSGELYWETSKIKPMMNKEGEITHFLAIKEDITLRKSYEEQLLYQANFDSLTQLPNRLLAFDRISQALASHKRDNEFVAVMFIDLDRFKNINDTLGHEAGDTLLVDTANRLKGCVRMEDTVARFGGDEFLVILPHLQSIKNAEIVAQKFLHAISKPFLIEKREIFTTASIGITIYPEDADDPQVLMRNADSAMYRAKDEGRNSYSFYTQEMNEKAKSRMEMEFHLRQAQKNHEFELHYQPIIDVTKRKLVGAEALLRWNNQELGSVRPDIFIPLAEDIGLILPIGAWVLRSACLTAASWRNLDGDELKVAVNVSAQQFRSGNIVETVSLALKESGLSPACLEIEVTEGLLLNDAPEILKLMQGLHNLGVGLSIDDFGTGYSALSYLKKFPFDVLKIDRSFVRDVITDSDDAALSAAIIQMAHGLNLKVIGEGVETREQLEFLSENSVDMVQGYLFSKPVPAADFVALLGDDLKSRFSITESESNGSGQSDNDGEHLSLN